MNKLNEHEDFHLATQRKLLFNKRISNKNKHYLFHYKLKQN